MFAMKAAIQTYLGGFWPIFGACVCRTPETDSRSPWHRRRVLFMHISWTTQRGISADGLWHFTRREQKILVHSCVVTY